MDYKSILSSLIEKEDYSDLKVAIQYIEQIKSKENEIYNLQNQLTLLTNKKALHEKNVYFVERKLKGANIGNQYVQETDLRKLDIKLQTGDYVKYENHQLKVVKHDDTKEGTPIVCFEKVIVEYNAELNRLVIRKKANGDSIKIDGYPFVITVNEKADVSEGDIVDYAFYRNTMPIATSASLGSVRWKYPIEELEEPTEKKKKKVKKENINNSSENTESHDSRIEFDLKNQKVLILTDYAHSEKLKDIVELHNGIPTIAGGARSNELITPSSIQQKVDNYDIVIICTDYLHHNISQNAISALKDKKIAKYAVANSSSSMFVEKALYRAENHLQAYEPLGANNEYPIKNDEND